MKVIRFWGWGFVAIGIVACGDDDEPADDAPLAIEISPVGPGHMDVSESLEIEVSVTVVTCLRERDDRRWAASPLMLSYGPKRRRSAFSTSARAKTKAPEPIAQSQW